MMRLAGEINDVVAASKNAHLPLKMLSSPKLAF